MKSQPTIWAFLALCFLCSSVAARRLALRPLSPGELRRALLEAGASDEQLSPDGRSISSAIAGIKGFALGVTKGIGGAVLFDVATSNETIAYVSYLLESINTPANGNNGDDGGTAQEVCFSSRSLNGQLIRGRSNDNDNDNDDNEDVVDFDNDDDDDDFVSSSEKVRQLDAFDTDYEYPDSVSNGVTCIVVNRGRTLFRHRRSAEKDSAQRISSSKAPLSP